LDIVKEYWTLTKNKLKYDKFCQYFRIPQCKFYGLLKLNLLQKQNTLFYEAISPTERLTICLK